MRQIDIKNFENYQITDDGRVWSKTANKYLKPVDAGKYRKVTLYSEGRVAQPTIHYLVASAFVPNPENLPEINHRDENTHNNTAENLEWCSHIYNMRYGTRTQRQIDSISKEVYQYTKDLELVHTYKSCTEAERENPQFNHRGISYACIGKLKTYKGYIWSHKPL